MKSFLVCTDFSESATHAVHYACLLSSLYKVPSLTLFHATLPQVVPVGVEPAAYSNLNAPNLEDEARDQLRVLKEELVNGYQCTAAIKIRSENMKLANGINQVCREEGADLVIMGTSGKSKFERAVLGSNAIDVAVNSDCPVLLVPLEAALQPVSHIVLACELEEVTANTPLQAIDRVISFFNPSRFSVLNVDSQNKRFSPQTPEEIYQLHYIFDKYKARYSFVENKDNVAGILAFAEQENASLVISIRKDYDFLKNLFHKSTTKRLIYNSAIPLLILQGGEK